jgi:beta-N-acetylhexosaminidase
MILVVLLSLSSCSSEILTTSERLKKMSVEEKVSQMLMVRCDKLNMDNILSYQPGGVLMFGVDFNDLTKDEVIKTIDGYKNACDIEPLIAVDEEGGTVVRVSSNPNLSEEKYQSPQFYYNQGGINEISRIESEKSEMLRSLGITMNLAPVADISQNPDDFIYDRSLGQDEVVTAKFISAAVTATKPHKVFSCLKHFPGYGNNVDTHTGIAVDNRPLQSLRERDFVPFKAGIDAGADAVLVSHNIITDVDSSLPASVSEPVHNILRNELGFKGIILTDDMSMQAMAEYNKPYAKAVIAGNDMIIVSDFNAAYNEILSAVKSGEIPTEKLDEAVLRILNKKQELK